MEAAWDGASRRVHKNIEAAKVFAYLCDTTAASCRIGHVGLQEADRCAMSPGSREKSLWSLGGLS
jgi:hypothetical protein